MKRYKEGRIYSGYTRDCKKFKKKVEMVNGKIISILRIFKDGSGTEYEKKRCRTCLLKFNGAKLKRPFGDTVIFNCPICDK